MNQLSLYLEVPYFCKSILKTGTVDSKITQNSQLSYINWIPKVVWRSPQF